MTELISVSRDNHFNFLRLLFALQVLILHAQHWMNLPIGDFLYKILSIFPGVPLFFVVSGFLVSDSYFKSSSIKEFFFKRGLRIYPALAVNIIILELAMLFGGNFYGIDISVYEYTAYLVTYIASASSGIASSLIGSSYLAIYNQSAFFSDYPSGVLWTLTVELTFYLSVPLFLWKRNIVATKIILFILFFVSIVISSISYGGFYDKSILHKLLGISVLPYLWMFIIGIYVRLEWKSILEKVRNRAHIYFACYVFFGLFFYDYLGNYKSDLGFFTVLQTLLMASVVFSCAYSFTHIRILRKADLSYATYLYHMLVVHTLIGLGYGSGAENYYVIVAITLAIAFTSWCYIEKPALALKISYGALREVQRSR
ncbi:acyltransferase family protein [Motiliproteus sediminis]|uniref:acyltransferase family protein n=1 Tax=Motiliproteus sediminis TaxID=1468178 RepID=UPI001AF020E0|nr:acyltransferase [Motiliproteus sediminis]